MEQEALVSRELATRRLFADALAGRIDRRTLLVRAAALGISAPVAAALAQESVRGALASEEGKPSTTFYAWMLRLHPTITTVGEEQGVSVETAPTENFGFDRFIAEANQKDSTWDSYGGVTPFLEMIPLVQSGTIEPWDEYLSEEMLNDFAPATRKEGTFDGKFYVWPLLLDICVQASNADLVAKAGLDPTASPKTWDEFIANAKKVQESGAAPYGLIFDNRDWRSLIPVTHSISTDVYTPDGLFQYDSDPAIQALEIMKEMMPLTSADVLAPGSVDAVILADEAVFQAQQAAYYFKYQNAPLRTAAQWPDPSKLVLARLPAPEGGAGGTVFWDTGAVLFKYGKNKDKTVEFFTALSEDERIWENSVVGDPAEGIFPAGQLPILQSLWKEWETNPPDWLTANPWAQEIYDSLADASAIAPTILGIKQFDTARPEWHKYLSGETADAKTAATAAMDAVRAEFKRETGKDPQ
jgi:ABC-type glycerol-3-phosphate transport system substrate-binding protein